MNNTLNECDRLTIRDLMLLSGYSDVWLEEIIASLFSAVSEGSVCLKLDKASADKLSAYPKLVASDENDYKPLILKTTGKESYLYFQKYPRYEVELKEALFRLVDFKETGVPSQRELERVLNEVLAKKPLRRGGRPMNLDEEQKRAVSLAIIKNFVIISGGPGTGKTSVIITILRCLVRLGYDTARIRIAAPTGRSAKRMADSIRQNLASLGPKPERFDKNIADVMESTVHRLLGYNPARNDFSYNRTNPIPADVVIVDEVSMIDIVLMARLFEAIAAGTKVILLGDKDQLPSVEAGAVLADLIPRTGYSDAKGGGLLAGRLVILKKSYRSEASLLEASRRVNEEDVCLAEEMPKLPFTTEHSSWPSPGSNTGALFLDAIPGDIKTWRDILDAWISRILLARHATCPDIRLTYAELIKKSRILNLDGRHVKDKTATLDYIFAYLEQGKILAFLRHGLYGTSWINRYISRRLQPLMDRSAPSHLLFAGQEIMITENDPIHELYNGDVGVILKSTSGDYRAVFRRTDTFAVVPLSELPKFETAFAITVHKSQGSEYDSVLIVLPQDETNRLLSKEIIYTALTRTRHSAVICGSRKVLAAAIGRKINRQSGIRLWG